MSDERGEYSPILRVLLDGPDFQRLSPIARHCFLTLKVMFGPSGIEVRYRGALASELEHRTGWAETECRQAVLELEAAGWLRIERNVVWIVEHLRYHPHMKAANKNHRLSLASYLESLPHLAIVDHFRRHYAAFFPELEIPSDSERDGIPMPLGSHADHEERRTNDEVRITKNEERRPSRAIGSGLLESQIANRLPSEPDRVALTALVAKVPAPDAWLAEINASLEGMPGHVHVTPEQLATALRDFVANGATTNATLRHFRGYLKRAGRAPLQEAAPAPTEAEGLRILRRIMDLAKDVEIPGRGTTKRIANDDVEKLGPAVLSAYKAVGGAAAILETPAKDLGFLAKRFAAVLEVEQAEAAHA